MCDTRIPVRRSYGARAVVFMDCVRVTLFRRLSLAPVAAPVAPEKWREIDMTGNNLFAERAATWLECHPSAKRFSAAEKELKGLASRPMLVAPLVTAWSSSGIAPNRLSISAMK